MFTAVYSKHNLLLVIAPVSADKYRLSAYLAWSVALGFVTPEIAKHFYMKEAV